MSEQTPPPTEGHEILDELRSIGQNLAGLLRGTWESEERRRLQEEIQKGLSDVSTTLSRVATDISQSPTGQTIKADLENLHERLNTGELEKQVRNEVLSALRMANEGIKKAGSRSAAETASPPPPPAEDQPAE